MIVKNIKLRKIVDSRGNSTVEADILTGEGFGRAAAPAGPREKAARGSPPGPGTYQEYGFCWFFWGGRGITVEGKK